MTILEDIKAGRLVVVPVEATRWQWRSRIKGGEWDAWEQGRFGQEIPPFAEVEERAIYTGSPATADDHTAGLIALIEGMERERDMLVQTSAMLCDDCGWAMKFPDQGCVNCRALAAEAERDEAREEADTLKALICQIEPYVDAIVCYASTIGEHEPNRIAHEVRAVANGPSQDELVGQQIAARMIAKIDAATAKPGVERAWLIELKGTTPSWAIVNPNDYDEHWTTDSTRALRFARKADAEAYIAHIGWTEAFPSEHIWDDGDRHDQ